MATISTKSCRLLITKIALPDHFSVTATSTTGSGPAKTSHQTSAINAMVKGGSKLRSLYRQPEVVEMQRTANDKDDYRDSDDNDSEESYDGSSEGDSIEYLAIATGIDSNCTADMVEVLRQAEENNLNFVCVSLFHPRLRVGEAALFTFLNTF